MTKILQICGYRRTGKDKFYDIISGNCDNNRFKWRIYRDPDENRSFVESGKIKYVKKSFASELKNEASSVYNIPAKISDNDKDLKQFKHYKTGQLVSARDIYIEWGKYRRSQDINYWCEKVLVSIISENIDDTLRYIITDWRFLNEDNYIANKYHDRMTIRLFRSDVPIPDKNEESEHQLDNYKTDFLLIRDDLNDEFGKAIEIFPQYKEYIQCGFL